MAVGLGIIPQFPASVVSDGSISITVANGVFTFGVGNINAPSVAATDQTFVTGEAFRLSVRNSNFSGNSVYSEIFPGVTNYDTLQGVAEVTAGSTVTGGNAVAAYVRNKSGVTNGVALFGVATAEGANSKVWGVNTLIQDSNTRVLGSATGRVLIGFENDINVMNPASSVTGYSTGGNSLAQPANAVAYQVSALNAITGIYWATGFGSHNGAADTGLALGTLQGTVNNAGVLAANAPSQKLLLGWSDGAAAGQSLVMQMAAGFLSISATAGWNGISLVNGALSFVNGGYGIRFGGVNAFVTDGSGNYTIGDAAHTFTIASAGLNFALTTTTSATAGAASALPGVPAGYISVLVNNVAKKIPYWNT